MPKLKGKLTFRQFLEKKEYNLYRNFKDQVLFSMRQAIEWVDEWEEEKLKDAKMKTRIEYSLWDSRAETDRDGATCFSICQTLKEAKREKKEDFTDAVIFRDVVEILNNNAVMVIKSERVC